MHRRPARAASLPLMKSRFRRIPKRNISFTDGDTVDAVVIGGGGISGARDTRGDTHGPVYIDRLETF